MVSDRRFLATASGTEFGQAVELSDLPLVVTELPGGVVRLANSAADDLLGLSGAQVIGHAVTDLFAPSEDVEVMVEALGSGAIDAVRAHREIHRPGGQLVPILVWSRAVQLDGMRAAVSVFAPTTEVPRLGCAAFRPSEIAAVVGVADGDWRIEAVSSDVRALVGASQGQIIGSSLCDLLHPEDRALFPSGTNPDGRVPAHVRVGSSTEGWRDVSLLYAPFDPSGRRMAFALVSSAAKAMGESKDRVAELELRLRRIGAEVRASRVLEGVQKLPDPARVPQLRELSSRQWEILSRLVDGQRVPSIADDLYLSRSTIRNHLTAIFRKFGVHSQAELLERLRRS